MMRWTILVATLLCAASLRAQAVFPSQNPSDYAAEDFAPPPPLPAPVGVPTPYDLTVLAWTDLATLAEADRPFQKYFATHDRSEAFHGAFDYAMNTCLSHSSVLYRSHRVADGWLLRVDLRAFWPDEQVYAELYGVFEKMTLEEPYFHTLGEIEIKTPIVPEGGVLDSSQPGKASVKVAPYVASDGKTYTHKWVPLEFDVTKQQAAEPALHLLGVDPTTSPIASLILSTGSQIPIVMADWFLCRVGTQDPNERGLYYAFRRFEKSDATATAEAKWLATQGLQYEAVQNIRSDQRIARWRSRVTGNSRAIEYFFTPATRGSIGPATVTITRDWFVGPIDPKRHPFKNLVNYDYDGSEAIGFLPNGMQSLVLFNDAGDLADVGPPNLVADRTIPAPHPTNLSPPISCIRCHAPNEGWQPAKNDVMAMTSGKLAVDIFDEPIDGKSPQESLDRIAGLYSGQIDEALRLSRNTHAKATFIVTGGMSITDVSVKLSEIFAKHRYDPVTPQTACLELGWQVPAEHAATFFDTLIPRLPANRHGISPETPVIAALRNWDPEDQVEITRHDWEHEFADAMLRVTIESVRAAHEVRR